MNKSYFFRLFVLINIVTFIFTFNSKTLGVEPKETSDVEFETLIDETQELSPTDSGLSGIWWIPLEFWQVGLEQDSSITEAGKEQILRIIEPYFMLGVIKENESSLDNAEFSNLEQIKQNLTFSFITDTGEEKTLTPVEEIPSDLEPLQEGIRIALQQRLGQVGENFHLLVFENTTPEGDRLISPYESGTIDVTLSEDNNVATSNLTIELPLNSLYVPRICPNGKEAHISWEYCPWDGTELEE